MIVSIRANKFLEGCSVEVEEWLIIYNRWSRLYWWWPAMRGEVFNRFAFYVQVKGFCAGGQGGRKINLL